jgi:hypothetical protein
VVDPILQGFHDPPLLLYGHDSGNLYDHLYH